MVSALWLLLLLIVLCALVFAYPRAAPLPSPPPFLPTAQAPQAAAKDSRGPTKVFELNSDQEADVFASGDKGILMVYAPWCGHCKTMMPAFDIASTQTPVRFARLEGSKAPAFMAKHQIRGFPTILAVKDGVVSRYNSGRDAGSLVAHASTLQ